MPPCPMHERRMLKADTRTTLSETAGPWLIAALGISFIAYLIYRGVSAALH
jgi:hypothetical protein